MQIWHQNELATASITSCPSIFFFLTSSGSQWARAYPRCHGVKGRVHPGQGANVFQGEMRDRQTTIHTYGQFTFTKLNPSNCMSLNCGRKPEYPERTHADMTWKERLQADAGFKPRTQVLTTPPLCCTFTKILVKLFAFSIILNHLNIFINEDYR